MKRKTILIPLEVEMPDNFDIEFRCNENAAKIVYTEYFPELEEAAFEEIRKVTLQAINLTMPSSKPDIYVDKVKRLVTLTQEGPRQTLIEYLFGELAGQVFQYREEVKEWCSHAINIFPTRPESKQTQVFREEERLNILEEKVKEAEKT